ncbi:MAG: anthranilate synthase component I family protein [Acidobacteriota bacterium]
MRPAAATLPLRPVPDPGAVLLGLCAMQADGEPVEPFLMGGDLAFHGEAPRPVILLGWQPVDRWIAAESAPEQAHFPWEDGAAAFFAALDAFLQPEPVSRAEGRPAGKSLPFSEGISVGWIGHELPATCLVRHETIALFQPRDRSARIVACAPRGVSFPAARAAARERARMAADLVDRAAARGMRLQDHGMPAISRFVRRTPVIWTVDEPEHHRRIREVLNLIAAGEVYQVNLAHPIHLRFPAADPVRLAQLFLGLWRLNPVPFPAYVSAAGTTILGLSPERYIARRGQELESRPIKGTRPRGSTPREDARLVRELQASEKDRAENIMIVDLVRNDLGRIALPGGVRVQALCQVESFRTVHHLVSTVKAAIPHSLSAGSILEAIHPPGSMTGAPKIAAVKILSRLEGTPRGPYAGGIGWFAGTDHFHLAMVIRSLLASRTRLVLPVGGGIVADSQPDREYRETLDKAAVVLDHLLPARTSAGAG